MYKFLSKKGISLVEISVVSIIAVFIMLTLMALLSSGRSTLIISSVKSDLYINARKAMNEMFDDLVEASSGNTEVFVFVDPINGQSKQGLWIATARGSNTVAGEDASAHNNYVHLDANNVASWRSIVIYCPYENAAGIQQLRRYIDYGSNITFYSQTNIFPLTFASITTTMINFIAADGTAISIDRTAGRVLANNISSEDVNNNNVLDANENDGIASDPIDNEDGILNYGVNFTKNIGSVDIVLFLAKQASRLKEEGIDMSTTLRNKVKFRQP